MKKLLYLSMMLGLLVLALAATAFGQTVETAPRNADGSCPEGFVTVNAPFCAQESPNTPGRIFGYGEGDLAGQYGPGVAPVPGSPECPNVRITPDGRQCSDLPDVIFDETETAQYGPTELCPLGLDQFPAGTVCGEGGGYVVPEEAPVSGSQDLALPVAETQVTETTTPTLPATGGLPLVPLAGASLLVLGVAGYAIKRRVS